MPLMSRTSGALLIGAVLLLAVACKPAVAASEPDPFPFPVGKRFVVTAGEYRGAVIEVWGAQKIDGVTRYALVLHRGSELIPLGSLVTGADIAEGLGRWLRNAKSRAADTVSAR